MMPTFAIEPKTSSLALMSSSQINFAKNSSNVFRMCSQTLQKKSGRIAFRKKGNPNLNKIKNFPLDKSLVELGFMDSFGIIDTVTYIENKWKIKIDDIEITKEKFGSVNKMVNLIYSKLKK